MVNYYIDMWLQRPQLLDNYSHLLLKKLGWMYNKRPGNPWQHESAHGQRNLSDISEITKEIRKSRWCKWDPTRSMHFKGWITSCTMFKTLNQAQTRYTTTSRELLSIVQTLKEFRNVLCGQRTKVQIDLENLNYKTFNTNTVMKWNSYIKQYSPDLQYLKGTHKIYCGWYSQQGSLTRETIWIHQMF